MNNDDGNIHANRLTLQLALLMSARKVRDIVESLECVDGLEGGSKSPVSPESLKWKLLEVELELISLTVIALKEK
jgi:hypothetical protein